MICFPHCTHEMGWILIEYKSVAIEFNVLIFMKIVFIRLFERAKNPNRECKRKCHRKNSHKDNLRYTTKNTSFAFSC